MPTAHLQTTETQIKRGLHTFRSLPRERVDAAARVTLDDARAAQYRLDELLRDETHIDDVAAAADLVAASEQVESLGLLPAARAKLELAKRRWLSHCKAQPEGWRKDEPVDPFASEITRAQAFVNVYEREAELLKELIDVFHKQQRREALKQFASSTGTRQKRHPATREWVQVPAGVRSHLLPYLVNECPDLAGWPATF